MGPQWARDFWSMPASEMRRPWPELVMPTDARGGATNWPVDCSRIAWDQQIAESGLLVGVTPTLLAIIVNSGCGTPEALSLSRIGQQRSASRMTR
jgi:hypothetical protein